jgi:hypothetical protein
MKGRSDLLAATGSFVELPEHPRRLREVGAGFLPNFGATPAWRTAERAKLESECGLFFEGDGGPFASGAPAVEEVRRAEPAAEAEARAGGAVSLRRAKPWLVARYEPAQLLRGLLRAGSLGRKGRWRVQRRAVQGELALANIRVVRNDLRDTDFELVPVRTEGAEKGAGDPQGGGGWLGRVWRRLIGGWGWGRGS